ncbi:hypothetical protein CSKR_106446 [Clonorchis sinensis]|uniref:EGF-like domain-containing protein n=1 Tax=Clonorchis sinensis TaxID=79923 RepID=A0A8T1N2D4_CLOSI|nr:hypothetical protein CSKR_106446 [Clonorchis sinensis]
MMRQPRLQFILTVIQLSYMLGHVEGTDTRIKIVYPLHWYQSRTTFGFPFHFKAFYMPVLADWKTSSPTLKSWQYLSTAHYEIPRYVKEGYWIPQSFKLQPIRHFRSYCTKEAASKSYADTIHAFTYEDFTKDPQDSIRQHFTLSGKYYDQGYFIVLYYLLNICLCLRNRLTDLHCPNPCWRPNACSSVQHSTGVCHVVSDPSLRMQIHHRLRSTLRGIYDLDHRCDCDRNYVFNRTENKCIQMKTECGPDDCYNGGLCESLPVNRRGVGGMTYVCHCPPAWQGPMCEEARNPCKLSHSLCEPYQCVRDVNNRFKGYACACPPGTRSMSHTNPRCININECKELTSPCLNGGICVDREPPAANTPVKDGEPYGYACLCRFGFSGARCERPPPRLHWSGWSQWSKCSASCGLGYHTRYRTCPLPNRCDGRRTETGRCLGPVTYCSDAVGDSALIPYGLGTQTVQSWDIGWTAHEDRNLDDAFFWSETEDGWPNLYYVAEGFQFADILTWTKLSQLSRQWSITQLMIFHAVVLGLVTVPILLIFLAISRTLQSFVRRHKKASQEGSEDK